MSSQHTKPPIHSPSKKNKIYKPCFSLLQGYNHYSKASSSTISGSFKTPTLGPDLEFGRSCLLCEQSFVLAHYGFLCPLIRMIQHSGQSLLGHCTIDTTAQSVVTWRVVHWNRKHWSCSGRHSWCAAVSTLETAALY